MGKRAAFAAALAVAFAPGLVAAQQPPPANPPGGAPPPADRGESGERRQGGEVSREMPGYCRYVEGVADAESALLVAPEIFGTVGAVNAGEAGGGTPLGRPRGRLTLGLQYDFIELWQGLQIQDRAAAECRRYLAEHTLQSAVRAGADVGAAPAHAARARVLAEALPAAERLVASLRQDVQHARATLDEVDAVRLRLDSLRREAREVMLVQQRVETLPHAQGRNLVSAIETYRQADDEVESVEGSLRKLEAWSVQVRGGYDEIFEVDQEVPLFGLLTVSFDLGGLWVPGANEEAKRGRRRWIEEDVMGANRRVSELVGQLRTVREAERARLQEVSLLVEDLASQLEEVQGLDTARVRRYESFLFFELTRLRGEQAYLETHVAELDRIIGSVEM